MKLQLIITRQPQISTPEPYAQKRHTAQEGHPTQLSPIRDFEELNLFSHVLPLIG